MQVYHILMRHTSCLQPLSVDEAYLDVTGVQPGCWILRGVVAMLRCAALL